MTEDIKKDILWRIYLVYLGIFLLGLAIIGKAAYIQVAEGKELIQKSEKQEIQVFDLEANRGNIYDADERLLATSVPIFEIRMDAANPNIHDKYFNENIDVLAAELSKLFGDRSKYQYKKGITDARKNGNRYYLIKRKVSYDELKKLRTFPIFERGRYKGGLIANQHTRREMPFNELARRTIGYEKKEQGLFVGLEGAYNDVLEGTDGKQIMRRVSNNEWIPDYSKEMLEPSDGLDIITTIEINIQDVAENALHEHLKQHQAYQGCAVLMEVSTGHIKAIANLRLDEETGEYYESYNYAIAEGIEPGSTFKLPTMVALMEDGKINLGDTIDVGDGWTTYSGLTMQDVKKIRDGRITIREAFEKSSNVGISMITVEAYKDDPAQYINRLYSMSLNQKLGIEIAGEGIPMINHPDSSNRYWSAVSLPWTSIGYELHLTPLQTLSFYNAIANNGVMVKPMFVKEIMHAGRTIKSFEPQVINSRICSQATIDSARSLLEGVVERGTATLLKNKHYKVAGKTGTAQIADRNRGYEQKIYNATFVGYFPADNPKYSCIVVVNDPAQGKYYGGSVAAPVFREIADKVYATHLDIYQETENEMTDESVPRIMYGNHDDISWLCQELDIPVSTNSDIAEWIVTVREDESIRFAPRVIRDQQVPNVRGMSARDAVYILEQLGMSINLQGHGKVTSQSVEPGSRISKGQEITLRLSEKG
ncbi:MAG: penicillin-binding protein [Bacteroidales bacterium]|jgi:cell division protein FtsI (penicillin-binding protein 3)|nr:penicillin-binding protein [Bacteroidales bacterium]